MVTMHGTTKAGVGKKSAATAGAEKSTIKGTSTATEAAEEEEEEGGGGGGTAKHTARRTSHVTKQAK
jgi:hypothetical protein